jgi:hypothetical protein
VAPLPGELGMHGAKGNISRRVSYRYQGMDSSASSGGYAAKVALDDGFDRVVLAGVPMDGGFLALHARQAVAGSAIALRSGSRNRCRTLRGV